MISEIIVECIQGVAQGNKWRFSNQATINIGSDSSVCEIVIAPEPGKRRTISRWNSVLKITDNEVQISDCGSKNGTFLNEKLIGKRKNNLYNAEKAIEGQDFYKVCNEDKVGIGIHGTECVFMIYVKTKSDKKNLEYDWKEDHKQDQDETNDNLTMTNAYMILDKILEKNKREKANHPVLMSEEQIEQNESEKKEYSFSKIKKIGQGGFATVYLVEDINTKKKMALKEIFPQGKIGEIEKRKLIREFDMGEQFNHSKVINVFQRNLDENGMMSILMEYCEGGDLSTLLNREKRLDLELATNLMLQLLDALDYIHNVEILTEDKYGVRRKVKGIVHRDIKLPNILLVNCDYKCPQIKLSDFGLAKSYMLAGLSGLTEDGKAAGTLATVSRRQLINNGYKYAKPDVDIFAATACYYMLLTGSNIRNFAKYNAEQFAIIDSSLVPILERNKKIPVKLAKVIDEVLKEERYQNSDQFTSAVQLKQKIKDALGIK